LIVFRISLCLLSLSLLLPSCRSYKQSILFRVSEDQNLKQEIHQAEGNYIIQKHDYLQLDVYTNGGEKLIDPNQESFKNAAGQSLGNNEVNKNYLVDSSGRVKFPLLDELTLEALTIRQAEEILQKEYAKFYQNPFIILKYNNKRVVVLGALGGHVIPLLNENMKLTEILAMAKGTTNDFKAHNIRIIRDNQFIIADLSTYESYQRSNIIMQPHDIIYIEPIRRPFVEAIRDYSPIFTIKSSLTTLVVLVIGLNN
jgi:polysaccharide export outer membrane protein